MNRVFILTPAVSFGGRLTGCAELAPECGYHCCHQRPLPTAVDLVDPSEAILLAPGEVEGATAPANHLTISRITAAGGRFARCAQDGFDQSTCSEATNFKPLDCRSYPFFPSMSEGRLVLLKDQRCPLGSAQQQELDAHYWSVRTAWQQLMTSSAAARNWIQSISLPTYEPYEPRSQPAEPAEPSVEGSP